MADKKQLHTDHRRRMQADVQRNGLDSLNEHQVLEYLLFFAIPRRDTNPIAHRLLEHFGGFCQVLEAGEEELQQVEGIGPTSARLLHSQLEVARYYNVHKRKPRAKLDSTQARMDYITPLYMGITKEILYLVALDDNLRPLRTVKLGEGLSNTVSTSLSAAVKAAVDAGGSCAILTHNHPRGLPIPSREDVSATVRLVRALGMLGVIVLDHIIVAGDGEALSLRATGRMPEYDQYNGDVVMP